MSERKTNARNPKRARLFDGGRIHYCAECAYCYDAPIKEGMGECRRFPPRRPAEPLANGEAYEFPEPPVDSCWCGLFLPRSEVLTPGGGESAEGGC